MPTKINPKYKPSDRVYELLTPLIGSFELAREFVGHELPAFMMYWEDTGKPKSNWDSTCLNWMKRTYEDKKEAMARNRSFGTSKPNVIQEVAGGMLSEGMTPPARKMAPVISMTQPIPGEGETMSEDEALDKLSKIFG